MKTDRLKALAISDSGFIFDPVTGHSFSTNTLGIEIINLIKQGTDLDEIRVTLQAEYKVSPDELENDLQEFAADLKKLNLI